MLHLHVQTRKFQPGGALPELYADFHKATKPFSRAQKQSCLVKTALSHMSLNISCSKMYVCRFEGRVPDSLSDITTFDTEESDLQASVKKLETDIEGLVKEYIEAMEKIKLREGIRIAMSISSLGNKFFQVPYACEILTQAGKHILSGLLLDISLCHLIIKALT